MNLLWFHLSHFLSLRTSWCGDTLSIFGHHETAIHIWLIFFKTSSCCWNMVKSLCQSRHCWLMFWGPRLLPGPSSCHLCFSNSNKSSFINSQGTTQAKCQHPLTNLAQIYLLYHFHRFFFFFFTDSLLASVMMSSKLKPL